MNIPNWPKNKVLGSNGNFHPSLEGYFTQLNIAMQQNLSEQGYRIPNQSTSNIVQLINNIPDGNLLYDKDTNEAKIKINGVYRVISVI